ncbi:thioredoxin [Leptothermofonsia sp. ETS-13]|uniref:thioredoxin n=1 Tax=Leptothermofonsia sp. ETS-13 TaxID=3035696 RepID=UPI003B9EE0A6
MNINTLKLTNTNFKDEVLTHAGLVLVDFWAPWCGPCRVVGPTVEALADDFAERVKVGKVNVDENPEIASLYGIQAIPTILIFQAGQVVDRVVGIVPQRAIAEKLYTLLEQRISPSKSVA